MLLAHLTPAKTLQSFAVLEIKINSGALCFSNMGVIHNVVTRGATNVKGKENLTDNDIHNSIV